MLGFLFIGKESYLGLILKSDSPAVQTRQAFVLGPVSVLISVEQNCKVNDAHLPTDCSSLPFFLCSFLPRKALPDTEKCRNALEFSILLTNKSDKCPCGHVCT